MIDDRYQPGDVVAASDARGDFIGRVTRVGGGALTERPPDLILEYPDGSRGLRALPRFSDIAPAS